MTNYANMSLEELKNLAKNAIMSMTREERQEVMRILRVEKEERESACIK